MIARIAVSPEVALAVERRGEGPPVVLVMGLGVQLVLWPDEIVDGLVACGLSTLRFDNRDIGESTWLDHLGVPNTARMLVDRFLGRDLVAPYTLSDMAGDVVGLLDALGLARAHLVGVSLGGMIAQTMAIEHPTRVASLTSIMSSAGTRKSLLVHPRAIRQMLGRPPRNRDEYVARFVAIFQDHAGTYPPDVVRLAELAGLQYDRGNHPAGFARQFAAILASGSRLERLRRVVAPALVVHGTHDPLVPFSAGRAVADAIPGATFLPVEGMGHELPRPIWPLLVDAIAAHVMRAEAGGRR